jgi:endoglucanase
MKRPLLIVLLFVSIPLLLKSQERASVIRLNQIGYYPDGQKVAIITDVSATEFTIKSAKSGEIVFKSKLSSPRKSVFSDNSARVADFSVVSEIGSYVLNLPGLGDSYPFEIRPAVFTDLTKAFIKAFYFQRMSTPLPVKYAGKWSHPGGHPDNKVIVHPAAASPGRSAGTIISCPGGWYDAGDYNKYVVNSGITMGTLLSLYEDYPSYFDALKINIPESGNGAPDLLNEIVWNLRWMLTMQDPADGGVYNKVTNADFDEMVMPSECLTPRYIVPKGTAATLDFAAVMAQAGRISGNFKKVFPGLSDSCLKSAEKAWDWAVKNPKIAYDQNLMNKEFKPVINTGGYGDSDFTDEFIWAASELYISTGKESYYTTYPMFPDTLMQLPSWNDVKLLGYYTLARFDKKLTNQAKKDFPQLKARILREAENMIKGVSDKEYGTVMGKSAKDYVWGSNSVAANQGILLIQAYKLSKERKYLDYALTNLDYILGRNATGYSFVTGYGHKTPMFPHHRLSKPMVLQILFPVFLSEDQILVSRMAARRILQEFLMNHILILYVHMLRMR